MGHLILVGQRNDEFERVGSLHLQYDKQTADKIYSKSDFKAILVNSLKEKLPSKQHLMFKVIYHNDNESEKRQTEF